MNRTLIETSTIIIYKILDWLKQESFVWWLVVQSLLWGSFGLIYSNLVNFRGEDFVLVTLGGLMSGVGVRTTKRLEKSKETIVVNPDKFKEGVASAMNEIEKDLNNKLKIVSKFLNQGEWVAEKTKKSQIVLHHSVSTSVDSIYTWWNSDQRRIGTAYSIDRDGTIYNYFPDDEWGYHLNISLRRNAIPKGLKRFSVNREKESIGIELVSAGGLILKEGKWYSSFGTIIPEENVYKVNHRGYAGFERYTDEQLSSLKKLIKFLSDKYNIPITVPTFDINLEALKGKSGIWGHHNYNSTKSDIFPQDDLIQMLTEIKNTSNASNASKT